MHYTNRFTHALAFAALAIFLLPALHAQTAADTQANTHSANMVGNHKDAMSTAAPPSTPGNGSPSQQPAEVRTEKLNYKQKNTETQIQPSSDTVQKKHVANVTAANPQGSSSPNSNAAGTSSSKPSSSSSSTTATTDKGNYKQDFGQIQASKH